MAQTHFSGPIAVGSGQFLDLTSNTAAVTLTAADDGKTILLGGTGVTITVPPAGTHQGMHLRFVVSAAFATDYVITNGAVDTFEGCILEAGAVQDVDAADTLTLEDGVENIGDFIEMFSDGTSWICFGNFLTAASITPAG